jgi:hypothetical protein
MRTAARITRSALSGYAMSQARFASFWHGPELSPYEAASLRSVTAHGGTVSLYSYEPVEGLPAGVIAKDAREILPPDALNDFLIKGVPSIARFSDYFRFAMLTRTGDIWIDTDMLLLRNLDLDAPGDLIGRSTADSLGTALLRLSATDPRLQQLLNRIEAMKRTDSRRSDTGPRLLTAVYGMDAGLPETLFYPVRVGDYYKVFLPRYLDECTEWCVNSYALHLWNHCLARMGMFKRIGPPAGSFLHQLFDGIGINGLFREFYPADVMQTMIENAVEKVGRDDGVRKLLRVGVPLIGTAIARKFGR